MKEVRVRCNDNEWGDSERGDIRVRYETKNYKRERIKLRFGRREGVRFRYEIKN